MRELTVFPGCEFRIGADISVKMIDVKGGRVRLGFIAPPGVSINRQEVYLQIRRNGKLRTRGKPRSRRQPKVACSGPASAADAMIASSGH